MNFFRFACVVAIFSINAGTAVAQSEPKAPVLAPLSEKSTLPQGDVDTIGFRLGMPLEEALSKLKELGGGKLGVQNAGQLSIRDNRGNSISFFHYQTAQVTGHLPDGTMDTVTLTFSSTINEARVFWVQRDINYVHAKQQGSRPQLVEGMIGKFGRPSWQTKNGTETYWVWAGGKLQSFSEQDVQSMRFNRSHPTSCLTEHALTFAVNAPTFGGCTTMVKLQILPGARDDLLSSAQIKLFDFARHKKNVEDTSKWVEAEMQKATSAKTGSAPRL